MFTFIHLQHISAKEVENFILFTRVFFNVSSVKDPAKRLGGGPTDAKEIKGHAFFENISWDELEQKKVRKRGRHKLFVFRIWDIFLCFFDDTNFAK